MAQKSHRTGGKNLQKSPKEPKTKPKKIKEGQKSTKCVYKLCYWPKG